MQPSLLLTHIGQIATLSGSNERPKINEEMKNLGIIEDGAIAISGDRIAAVGPTRDVLSEIEDASSVPSVDFRGMSALPGFVDSHTHLVFGGSREHDFVMKLAGKTYMDILRAGGGILNTLQATRAASIDELARAAFSFGEGMTAAGTTTIEVKSGYGLSTEHELKMLKVSHRLRSLLPTEIVSTFMGAHAVPPEFEGNTDGYVDLIVNEMIPAVAAGVLAEFCYVFCEKGVFDIEQSRRVLLAAKRAGLRLKVHADELTPLGGAGLAAEVGAVSADHLLHASKDDLESMRRAGTVATLLPATSFSLNAEYAPAREMIDMGLPVALATDFNPNCANESMFFTLALACYKMRMRPEEAITAATINAAHALGRAHETGSIEVGKRADIIILECPNPHYISYRFGVNLIHSVIAGGKMIHTRLGP